MLISRNRPGVANCDDCRKPRVPTLSWSLNDDSDGLGVQGLGSIHLCEACLSKYAARLAGLPPFLEVMRRELSERGIELPTHQSYADVLAAYQEQGFVAKDGGSEPQQGVDAVIDTNAPFPPTIPEIRRMTRLQLEQAVRQYAPALEPDRYDTKEQLATALVEHFEGALSGVSG